MTGLIILIIFFAELVVIPVHNFQMSLNAQWLYHLYACQNGTGTDAPALLPFMETTPAFKVSSLFQSRLNWG